MQNTIEVKVSEMNKMALSTKAEVSRKKQNVSIRSVSCTIG